MSMSITIFNMAEIVNYFRVYESVYGENKNVIVDVRERFA